MDKKQDFIKAINYAKYLAFILATICVFVFQFTAKSICVTLALSFYVVAFGLMFTSLVIHCVEIYDADKLVKTQNASVVEPNESQDRTVIAAAGELKGEQVEVVSLKSEKVWSVLGAIFFAMITVFTFVVLVLF